MAEAAAVAKAPAMAIAAKETVVLTAGVRGAAAQAAAAREAAARAAARLMAAARAGEVREAVEVAADRGNNIRKERAKPIDAAKIATLLIAYYANFT